MGQIDYRIFLQQICKKKKIAVKIERQFCTKSWLFWGGIRADLLFRVVLQIMQKRKQICFWNLQMQVIHKSYTYLLDNFTKLWICISLILYILDILTDIKQIHISFLWESAVLHHALDILFFCRQVHFQTPTVPSFP